MAARLLGSRDTHTRDSRDTRAPRITFPRTVLAGQMKISPVARRSRPALYDFGLRSLCTAENYAAAVTRAA